MIREKAKNLWKLCSHNESEEFTELYFRLRYNGRYQYCHPKRRKVIAALQMLPYPMTFEGEDDFHAAYMSACTHPDYRNRGGVKCTSCYHKPLHGCYTIMWPSPSLIPAEPVAVHKYSSGYAPYSATCRRECFIASGTPTADTSALLWKCLPNMLKKI